MWLSCIVLYIWKRLNREQTHKKTSSWQTFPFKSINELIKVCLLIYHTRCSIVPLQHKNNIDFKKRHMIRGGSSSSCRYRSNTSAKIDRLNHADFPEGCRLIISHSSYPKCSHVIYEYKKLLNQVKPLSVFFIYIMQPTFHNSLTMISSDVFMFLSCSWFETQSIYTQKFIKLFRTVLVLHRAFIMYGFNQQLHHLAQ